jgi:uncharacterized membrane-anchored protein
MENKKNWIFIGYAVILLLIPTYIIGSSETILSSGKLYKFRMQGKDPFDFFRGNYLTVRIDTDGISTDKSDWRSGEKVYLSIDVDEDGFAFFDEALPEPPKKGDYMESRVVRWWDTFNNRGFGGRSRERTTVDVEMPNNLNKYFVNEEFAKDGEYAIGRRRNPSILHVRVLNGGVRIEDIYIEGTALMKYLEEGGPITDEESELSFQF